MFLPFPSPVLRGGISLPTITVAGILLFTSKEVTDPDQLVVLAGYAKGWYQPCHCPRRGNQQKPGCVWSPHTAFDLPGKQRPFVPVLPSCCSRSIVESWKNRRDIFPCTICTGTLASKAFSLHGSLWKQVLRCFVLGSFLNRSFQNQPGSILIIYFYFLQLKIDFF